MRLYIDDSSEDTVDKINSILESYGLRIEYDKEEMRDYNCVEDVKIIKINGK